MAMQSAGLSLSGSVRHQGQLSAASFRISLSGHLGSRGGCLLPRLGLLDVNISFPTISSHSGCGTEVVTVPRFRFPDCSSVGISKLVRQPSFKVSSKVSASKLPFTVSGNSQGSLLCGNQQIGMPT